jgi:hypothetical protein
MFEFLTTKHLALDAVGPSTPTRLAFVEQAKAWMLGLRRA